MIVKTILVLLAVSSVCGQLDLGILMQLYYPQVLHARPSTTSTMPPMDHTRTRNRRSYFDRDDDVKEGNNAVLNRIRAKMADPQWTPEVGSRSPWLD